MRMDGRTTVQALWDEACRIAAGDVPTQNEIVDLLVQLHAADLLQADVTPDSATVLQRYKQRRDQIWKQWLANPLSLRVPLWNPDAFLGRWAPRVGWIFGSVGGLLWLAVVLPALVSAGVHWSELTDNLADRLLATDNLLLMALVYPCVKALHELGHGFVTKTRGGHVPEMGLMFLVFVPVPYVEASAASAFPSKYQRMAVGAAGIMVELFLAALAMYVWNSVEQGLVHAIAYNVMLIAGVSTLLINGNPLLRYDGYYILADLLEIPNLAQRGQRFCGWLWDRYVFGARDLEPPPETPAERRWLVLYTLASWSYRIFITSVIIFYIAGKFFIFGTIMAIWGAISLVVLPVYKAIQHVRQSPTLQRVRGRALNLSLALVAGLALLVAAVPLPLRSKAEGVIWLPDQALVRAGDDGVFQRWLVAPGTFVRSGTPVLVMEEPLLEAELGVAQAKLAEAEAQYRAEQIEDPVKGQIALRQVEQAQFVLERALERHNKLVVSSQIDGVLVVPSPLDMPGQFFKKGELLGYILENKQFIARVVVRQDNIDLVRTRLRGVELRLSDDVPKVLASSVIREMPGGVDELPTAALGSTGGGAITTDPKDSKGLKSLQRIFIFDLQLPTGADPSAFGERVHVRFEHGYEPLLFQGYRRLRQLFLSRFSV